MWNTHSQTIKLGQKRCRKEVEAAGGGGGQRDAGGGGGQKKKHEFSREKQNYKK